MARVFMMPTLSLLVPPDLVGMTTADTNTDDKVGSVTTSIFVVASSLYINIVS